MTAEDKQALMETVEMVDQKGTMVPFVMNCLNLVRARRCGKNVAPSYLNFVRTLPRRKLCKRAL